MTRTNATLFATAAATLGIIGSAFAAEMTEAELKAFLSGNTTYLETAGASASGTAGQGTIYWAEDGTALYKIPSGAIWHGTWKTISGDQLCADWKERPNNNCVQYDKDGDKITVHDAHNGEFRATIVKTAHGNAEHLAP
ncbi:MAG: hypothetical protein WB774_00615 [Xanthobacteraceae bacterium]